LNRAYERDDRCDKWQDVNEAIQGKRRHERDTPKEEQRHETRPKHPTSELVRKC
jgi:hypothetical protein